MKNTLINGLIGTRFNIIPIEERRKIIIRLQTKYHMSERDIEKETGISHSTIHDWISRRQDNTKENIHISIDQMIRKLEYYKPKLEEFPKLEKLNRIIEKILRLEYNDKA